MSNGSLRLSPKFGVNPTIPVCFWCGAERGEVVLMGRIGDGRKHEDIEAPRHMVIDYEPCEHCKNNMAQGFTVMEATTLPNDVTSVEIQKGVYPTGRYVVLTHEAATRIFSVSGTTNKAFLEREAFMQLFNS